MHEEEFSGHIVYAPEVIEFVRLSNEFCRMVENLSESSAEEFIKASLGLLSGIYASIIGLESPEPVYDDGNEKFVTEQDWSEVYRQVARLLGPFNQYLRIVNEADYDRSDLVTHNISEDLSDIYQELRDFTELYSRGLEDFMNDALWEVIENFEEHWGEKLQNATSALHQIYIKNVDFEGLGDDPDGSVQDPTVFDNSMFNRYRDHLEDE